MGDISVIVRRVLRHRIKSGEGLEKVVGDLLGEDWQSMLNCNRQHRDGIAAQIADQIQKSLNNSSFARSDFRTGDTSINGNRQTILNSAS